MGVVWVWCADQVVVVVGGGDVVGGGGGVGVPGVMGECWEGGGGGGGGGGEGVKETD